jgi:hypothetical protein
MSLSDRRSGYSAVDGTASEALPVAIVVPVSHVRCRQTQLVLATPIAVDGVVVAAHRSFMRSATS